MNYKSNILLTIFSLSLSCFFSLLKILSHTIAFFPLNQIILARPEEFIYNMYL